MSDVLGDRRVQRHAPIRDQVAAILRDAIVQMEFKPGQVLIERELCEMTSASRPSVREALRQLESEGLVESRMGRGTIVAVPTQEQAAQLYEVRAELEGMAAYLFALKADETHRLALRKAFADIENAMLPKPGMPTAVSTEILAVKDEFYRVMVAGAGNDILSDILGGLHRRVIQLRALTLGASGRAAESLAEIEVIMQAIEERDAMAARRAANFHVEQAALTALQQVTDS